LSAEWLRGTIAKHQEAQAWRSGRTAKIIVHSRLTLLFVRFAYGVSQLARYESLQILLRLVRTTGDLERGPVDRAWMGVAGLDLRQAERLALIVVCEVGVEADHQLRGRGIVDRP
jgi:hypothetical protein